MRYLIWTNLDPRYRLRTWDADRDNVVERALRKALPTSPDGGSDRGIGPVKRWNAPVLLDCKRRPPGPVRDALYGPNLRTAVSDRLRSLLERHAPGEFQFLPVVLANEGRAIDIGPYWIANPLRQVDCLNVRLSQVEKGRYGKHLGRCGRFPPYIDPDLVPVDALAFAIRFDSPWLIAFAEPVANKLRNARLNGVWFHDPLPARREDRKARASVVGPVRSITPAADAPRFTPPSSAQVAAALARCSATVRAARTKLARSFLGRLTGAHGVMSGEVELEVGPAPKAAAINDLERKLGHRLPRCYREFVRSAGWASVQGQDILGIGPKGQSAWAATNALRTWREIDWPDHLVVVGADGRGGDYCLDLSRSYGKDCPVVYHDHELDQRNSRTGKLSPSLEPAAGSFKGWIRGIALTGSMGPG